jgi:hypothetical protein
MTTKLACMPYVVYIILITRNDTGTNKLGESFMPKMTEMTMPKGGGCSDERRGAGGGWIEWVEVARTIAPGDHVPGVQILHRKVERIKLNGTVIVSGKMTNGNQILNNVGRHQNIVKNKIAMRKRKKYMIQWQ